MFRDYESFSANGSPQVLVPQSVINKYGEPTVNSESLGHLFEEDLGLPAEEVTIRFYKGNVVGLLGNPTFLLDSWPYGRILPFTNTLHIAAYVGHYDTPMEKVITLGYLMSDKKAQNPVRRLLSREVTVTSGAALGLGVADNIGSLAAFGIMGLTATAIFKGNNMPVVNTSNRHHDEINNLRNSHDSDITFSKQTELFYYDRAYGADNVDRSKFIKRIK